MMPVLATVLGFSDFAIIAWVVVVFAGAAAYGGRRAQELRRIERKLDTLLKHHGLPVPPEAALSKEVLQCLARNPANKAEALKLHLLQTGLDMAEAKADIEDYLKTRN
jgi:hypothetical protein